MNIQVLTWTFLSGEADGEVPLMIAAATEYRTSPPPFTSFDMPPSYGASSGPAMPDVTAHKAKAAVLTAATLIPARHAASGFAGGLDVTPVGVRCSNDHATAAAKVAGQRRGPNPTARTNLLICRFPPR